MSFEMFDALCIRMQVNGIQRAKIGDIEIDFGTKPIVHSLADLPKSEAKTSDQLRKEYEELLYASSGG